MPAITIDDTTRLPRIELGASMRERGVISLTTAPKGYEGEGFPVRRAFVGVDLRMLDPFVHLDQIGEVNYAPGEPKGTPWHPHRGFETATYMMDGVIAHADSTGGGGVIRDGATQWMTAGRGILHIETPPHDVVKAGGWFHGLQLWINLPRAKKMIPPQYQDLAADAVTLLTTADTGALVRVIAGAIAGHRSSGITHTPMTMVHASLSPGARAVLPWPSDYNALVYVLGGRGTVGAERRPIHLGQLAVLGAGESIVIDAAKEQDTRTGALEVLVLGGQPIREPIAWYGPFVMNTEDEIRQTIEDFRKGKLGTVPKHHPLAPTDEVVERTDSSLD
ncbi:MAG: chromosome condensation protein [Myxococcaceae bacterium]|jgi:redox-sensitive bicupin YhaK (pirin superfamily)|nr:chromosome condensation protein [Myxococcaceae bacterium]MEA2751744.1 quercetin 2,3-dioxygenase [Myxococcales bacterium]